MVSVPAPLPSEETVSEPPPKPEQQHRAGCGAEGRREGGSGQQPQRELLAQPGRGEQAAHVLADILTKDGQLEDSTAGTPQGSILSPLLANVALSVLDEHIAHTPSGPQTSKVERARRLRHGQPNFRLVRYADDWCLMVKGTRADAEALRDQIAGVLTAIGLRLSPDKTLITHIDEGLDLLGWRIQRHRKRGTNRHCVYVYPDEEGRAGRQGESQGTVPAGRNQSAAG
jgi:Reverse transcriptase (RNA-dependent DNA polymerase)